MRLVAVLVLSFLAACGEQEPKVTTVYEPYSGPPAYPERRSALPPAQGVRAFVSNNGSDTLSVLDLPSGEVLATIPVGRDPVNIDGPHHLALDPAGTVFVALSYPAPSLSPGPHSAHSSSRRSGYVLRLAPDDLRVTGQARVDPNPGEIVVSEDGLRLVVSHFDLQLAINTKLTPEQRRGTLAVTSPADFAAGMTLDPMRIPVCLAPHGVSLSKPDGARAYVACYGEDALAVVELTGTPSVTLIPVGPAPSVGSPVYGPYSAVLSPAGDRVAIGNTEGRSTKLFDAQTKTMLPASILSQGAPYFAGWSLDGTKLYIPTQAPDALLVVDPTTGVEHASVYFSAEECRRPHEATPDEAHGALYVVCEGDHLQPGNVLVLDLTSLQIKANIPVGLYPDRLVLEATL